MKQPKVVAVGEVGLDRHWDKNSRYSINDEQKDQELVDKVQRELFIKQVELATEFDKPLIIHSREVKDEVLTILNQLQEDREVSLRGVFHCYEGGKSMQRGL